jgi:pyruvate/2-oxoglutarate dehydrogenase complex dihydrolipoamide dehydrogenase (E3) component
MEVGSTGLRHHQSAVGASRRPETDRIMSPELNFDIAIIGAGGAGEAAAHLAASRGASVVIIERELFGGSCPFWACMPSKTLLNAAAHHAAGGEYDWKRASDRRDYMISREGTEAPSDAGHVNRLEGSGATVIRGSALVDGPGRVRVRPPEGGEEQLITARDIVLAVGSSATVPEIPGLDRIAYWTNREATSTRELPQSLVVLGAGPTGVEMAQVFARYGVPVTLIASHDRVNERDHPRSSAVLADGLRRDGVKIRTNVRATRVHPSGGTHGAHRIELSDGTHVEGHEVLLAVGRTFPLDGLGLETVGVDPARRVMPGSDMRIADHLYLVGDPAGPEMHTHLAHYQGEMAARIILGDDARPDYLAIPHAVYTDPEAAGVGRSLEAAVADGIDAFEEVADLATSAKGYVTESTGHVTIVVDRVRRSLVGAFIAGPGASEAIHEAVLAIKTGTAIDVLADTIHAFPTTSRVMGGLFTQAARRLDAERAERRRAAEDAALVGAAAGSQVNG